MALVVATTPPNLVVETKVKRRDDEEVFEEKHSICDSFWACMLNDYLDDEATAKEKERSLGINETYEGEQDDAKKKKKKKKKKKRKSSRSREKKPSVEPSMPRLTHPISPEESPVLDARDRETERSPVLDARDRETEGQDIKDEDDDLSEALKDEESEKATTESLPEKDHKKSLNREEKFRMSKGKSLVRRPMPEDTAHGEKASERVRKTTQEVFHYGPITTDLEDEKRNEGRNDSPRRAWLPLGLAPGHSELEEGPVPVEVQVSTRPAVTRRPIIDYDTTKRKKRVPIDPDEENYFSLRSISRARSRGAPRPEERHESDSDSEAFGDGTPDDPIELSTPRSPSFRGLSKAYDESEIPTVMDRKQISNSRKSRERGGRAFSDAQMYRNDRAAPHTNNEEPLIRMLKESKEIKEEYRRRKLDRKEALNRIRAIKARLASADT